MKRLTLVAATLLAACDATYVTPSAPVGDPCLYRTYHDPACDGSFSWSPGYYDSGHVWIGPRYVRRTVIVPHVVPGPVIVTRPSVVVPRTTVVAPAPYRPTYRAPVTTTTTIRRSRPLAPRATTTVTTTRRYR